MNREEFENLIKIIEDILVNMGNINSYLSKFNDSKNEMELENIRKELEDIHKILSDNNLEIKYKQNSKDNILDLLNYKINIIKNNTRL